MLRPTIIGYRKNGCPIWLIQGGAGDDGDAGSDSGDEPESQDDPAAPTAGADSGADASAGDTAGDASGEGETPSGVDDAPQDKSGDSKGGGRDDGSADPAANLRTALQKERGARKGLEKELAALRRQHASTEERALMEARETAATEREAQVKPPLVRALAASELRAAGVQGSGAARLVGLLDMEKVDIDEDGEVVGLADQIAGLREEFPNLFAQPSNGRVRPGNANAGSGSGTGRTQDKGGDDKPKPWYEQLADQVLQPGGPPGVGRR